MQDQIQRGVTALRQSQTLRLMVVGVLVLVLLIPVEMISGLVSERQQRRAEAVAEVTSSWGSAQAIQGPALAVPYTHRWTERTAEGQTVTRTAERTAVFLPERLEVRGRIETETLNRGIFSIPVYRLRTVVRGEFRRPSFSELGADVAAVDWDRARLAVGISDARAIQEETAVTWNGGRRTTPFARWWERTRRSSSFRPRWRRVPRSRSATSTRTGCSSRIRPTMRRGTWV